MNLFLGIDGGQSHTSALVADFRGRILGRGNAGASNHTREPGGRERLITAVNKSVGEALYSAGLSGDKSVGDVKFASAHLAMTGEPEDKVDIVCGLLRAECLVVAHDAPGALAGALAGEEGIVVLAGTGSVACGATKKGAFARIGGHGYMFGDEGSGFAIAREALAGELMIEDLGGEGELKRSMLAHFKRPNLKTIAEDFYAGIISRERLASFATQVAKLAEREDGMARGLLDKAAFDLARMAMRMVRRLGMSRKPVRISYGGGMFKSRRLLTRFNAEITVELPKARVVAPRFGPEIGALLLAYRQANKKITPRLLENITETQNQK
ncbi:MAG: N-acetylglucosamine kinase [Blastocatellales bacterium]